MAKIGILICDRERTCIGGKCFMAVQDLVDDPEASARYDSTRPDFLKPSPA